MADWREDTVVPSMEHGAASSPAWKSAIEAALTTFATGGDVGVDADGARRGGRKDAGFDLRLNLR